MPGPSAIAPFTFATADQIVFGRGTATRAAQVAAGYGRRVFLVHGAAGRGAAGLAGDLAALGVTTCTFSCGREPDLDMVEAALALARGEQADCVVSLGGGSVIDLGKAVAALLFNPGPALDYLEIVGKGLPLQADPAPFVALPTTAGTGAEATRNAVINIPAHRRKVSLRDIRMLPDVAIIDPALTDNTPRAVTLASGLDAVTQVIEPYVCARANPLTDALCRDAIPRGLKALARLATGECKEARDNLSAVSLAGGMALANAGLGAVHGLAGVIGGFAPDAPHGAICGTLLPHVLAANAAVAPAGSITAQRLDEVQAQIVACLGLESADGFAAWIRDQGLPTLAALGLRAEDHDAVAAAAQKSSSMAANPVDLSVETLKAILKATA